MAFAFLNAAPQNHSRFRALARDATHCIRPASINGTSVSAGACRAVDQSRRGGTHIADIDGGNVVALSYVVTAWVPREILVIGRAISQDVRGTLELSSHPDRVITWTDQAAEIEPGRYDLIWAYDRFALIDDAGAESALRQVRNGLAAGGRLVVPLGPDVGVSSPDADLFDQWFCFNRTGEDLRLLAMAAGFDDAGLVVRKDPTSGDLLLSATIDALA